MKLLSKIGEVVMRWVDRFAGPVTVPKENMDKFKASVEEGVEREKVCSKKSENHGSK